jgi:hypothetical protein
LKFLGEVGAWRACAVANEVELTKVPKSGGRRKKMGGRRLAKLGHPYMGGQRLLVVATSNHPPAMQQTRLRDLIGRS